MKCQPVGFEPINEATDSLMKRLGYAESDCEFNARVLVSTRYAGGTLAILGYDFVKGVWFLLVERSMTHQWRRPTGGWLFKIALSRSFPGLMRKLPRRVIDRLKIQWGQ